MIITRFRGRGTPRPILNKPKYKEDLFIFKHCANDKDEVSTREFNTIVEPLLFLYGISTISFEDHT